MKSKILKALSAVALLSTTVPAFAAGAACCVAGAACCLGLLPCCL